MIDQDPGKPGTGRLIRMLSLRPPTVRRAARARISYRFPRPLPDPARYSRGLASIVASLAILLFLTVGTALAAGATPTPTMSPTTTARVSLTPTATMSPTSTPGASRTPSHDDSPRSATSPSASPNVSPTVTPDVSPTLTSTATPTTTPTQTATPTRAPPLTKVAGLQPLKIEGNDESLVLNVPLRSQYDSSPYQNANCGPASLAMVLEAYGLKVPTERIRALSNQLQGTYDFDQGIALDYLVAIGQQAGLHQEGLYDSAGHYRQWAISDVIREVRAGYPVITLVHYNSLPQHQHESSQSDHYVVIVGVTSQGFLINDPASVGKAGYRQLLTPPELMAAWNAASRHQQAAAFLPPTGKLALNPVNGEAGDGPAVAALAELPGATRLASPPSPQPSPTVPTATPLPTNTPEPTVNPLLISEAAALKNWARPTDVPTPPPPAVTLTATAQPTTLARATPSRTPPSSPLPIVVVFAAMSLVSIGVIKATNR